MRNGCATGAIASTSVSEMNARGVAIGGDWECVVRCLITP